MTNEIDYGECNPFQACPDGEDLMRTIYAYYCNSGYPQRLQRAIDTTIKILSTLDNSYLEIEGMIMELAGATDLWGFRQGFRAAIEMLSGNTFLQIFKEEESNG